MCIRDRTYSGVTAGAPIPLSPTTKGGAAEDYIFTIDNTNIVRFKGQAAAKTFTGKSVELIAQSFGTPTPNASTLVNVQGVESGLVSVINITVKTDTTGTGDAQGTQDPTNTPETTGGGGGITYGGGEGV